MQNVTAAEKKMAKKLKKNEVSRVPFVPFKSYWRAFAQVEADAMNECVPMALWYYCAFNRTMQPTQKGHMIVGFIHHLILVPRSKVVRKEKAQLPQLGYFQRHWMQMCTEVDFRVCVQIFSTDTKRHKILIISLSAVRHTHAEMGICIIKASVTKVSKRLREKNGVQMLLLHTS